MKTQALNPWRAACAATALARLPVEEQLTTSNPKFRAWVSATATTRSLKLSEGKQTESFLRYRDLLWNCSARRQARTSGVKPTGRDRAESYCSGSGSNSRYRHSVVPRLAISSLLICRRIQPRSYAISSGAKHFWQNEIGWFPQVFWHSRHLNS